MDLFGSFGLEGGEVCETFVGGGGLGRYLVDVEAWKAANPAEFFEPAVDKFSPAGLGMLPDMGWILDCKFHLFAPSCGDVLVQREELSRFKEKLLLEAVRLPAGFCKNFPAGYNEPLIAIDSETTGLDVRVKYDASGVLCPQIEPVGIPLAISDVEGYYLPIKHTGADGVLNWDWGEVARFLGEVHSEFAVIYHNAQYDREALALNGVRGLRGYPYFFDTMLLHFLSDVNEKRHGLKYVSEVVLNRKMIEIHELFGGTSKRGTHIHFDRLPATTGYVYGISDALNTFGLFKHYASQPQEDNLWVVQPVPVAMDHKIVDVLRNMCRAGLPINYEYFYFAAKDALYRVSLLEAQIYSLVGREFDIGSPNQLSDILFEEFKLPPLEGSVKGKNGKYSTGKDELEELFKQHPDVLILKYVVGYRRLIATISKLYLKALTNSYVDEVFPHTRVKLSFAQTVIPTGRISSSKESESKERVTVKESDKGNLTYKYSKGSWVAGFNAQGISGQPYKRSKARIIKRLPSSAPFNVENPYPESVDKMLVQAVSSL